MTSQSYVDRASLHQHVQGLAGASGLHSLESELALVGGAVRDAALAAELIETVQADGFGDPTLGAIWGVITQLVKQGRPVAPAFIRDGLSSDSFDAWGGVARLLDLQETASTYGLAEHAAAVNDRAARRAIRRLADEVAAKTIDTSAGSAETILAEMEHGAAQIAQIGPSKDAWHSAGEMIAGAIERAQQRKGVIQYPSGLRELDRLLGGLHAGEMTILGARTGMGKTVGQQVFSQATAKSGRGTLVFSLEMSADAMALRLACDLAFDRYAPTYMGRPGNPTLDRAMRGDMEPHLWERLRETDGIVQRWPLMFDDRPGLTMAQIEAVSRRQFRRWERAGVKPGLVVIDHLGKVRPGEKRNGQRNLEIADISNACAEMAKRLHVPVLALCQLNRGVEHQDRRDKRPVLADLRQAGELEEDARQVIFLYRPEYYLRDAPEGERGAEQVERLKKLDDVKNRLYWIVEKNSHGPRGQALTFCDMASSAVRDWD